MLNLDEEADLTLLKKVIDLNLVFALFEFAYSLHKLRKTIKELKEAVGVQKGE